MKPTFDCRPVPDASSLQATWVRPSTALPVNTPISVSKSEPKVSARTVPLPLNVARYQMLAPPVPPPQVVDSPGSMPAPTVVPRTDCPRVITCASAKSSLAMGEVARAVYGLEVASGPGPSAFTAATRKVYVVPTVRPVKV